MLLLPGKRSAEKRPPPAADEAGSRNAKAGAERSPCVQRGSRSGTPEANDRRRLSAHRRWSTDRVEEDQVRQEVLKRIDLMRGLSDADKDKLYVQVERARGFTKIGTIRFTQSGTTPASGSDGGLNHKPE